MPWRLSLAAHMLAALWAVAAVQLAAFSLAAVAAAEGADETPTAAPSDPAHDALVRRHDELVPQIRTLWQQGKDREVLTQLEQLLALYQQIFPPEKFPDGHPHIVLCYRDLCRVTDTLGEEEALWRYCQDGLAMCRRLFPRDKCPQGSPDLAHMLANAGNALIRQCQYAAAREYLMEAVREYSAIEQNGQPYCQSVNLIRLYHLIAKTLDREGRLVEVCNYTDLALELARQYSSEDGLSPGQEELANCLLLHGRSLRDLSRYRESMPFLLNAIDEYLHSYLVCRTESAHLGLIDALAEMGALQFQMGKCAAANQMLKRAYDEVGTLNKVSHSACSLEVKILGHLLRLAHAEGMQRDVEQYRSELENKLCPGQQDDPIRIDSGRLVDSNLDIGLSFLRSGRIELAEKYFLSARELVRGAHVAGRGPIDLPRTVCVDCYVGCFYQTTGQYYRAYKCFADAMKNARHVFVRDKYPKGHAILAMAVEHMATHLWHLGETDASVALFRELCEMNDSLYKVDDYPRGHRLVMIAHASLGQLLLHERAFDEAAEHLNKALEMACAVYPVSEYPDGHDELSDIQRDFARLELAREVRFGQFVI